MKRENKELLEELLNQNLTDMTKKNLTSEERELLLEEIKVATDQIQDDEKLQNSKALEAKKLEAEAKKLEAEAKEKKKDRIIKGIEIGAAAILAPTIGYFFNKRLTKNVMKWNEENIPDDTAKSIFRDVLKLRK